MAFIQITEPNTKNPAQDKENRLCVGIDLGTTFCAVAKIDGEDRVNFYQSDGKSIIPSVALYTKTNCFFGYEALKKVNSKNTLIHSVKRLIGVGMDKIINPQNFPYPISQNNQNNLINIHTEQGIKNPIEVSADLLMSLKKIVYEKENEQNLEKILDAVITVPAYFDDSQRQATKDAGKIAGINVLRIINEPTSAAFAYGLDNDSNGVYAIYDLGGGTFDFSILKMQKGIFQVLASSGDTALGGNDVDEIIINQILKIMELEAEKVSHSDLFELWQRSKEIKHCLTYKNEISTVIEIAGKKIEFSLNKNEFENLIKPIIEKTVSISNLAIKDAKIDMNSIKGIVLVGGSSRIPLISKMLKEKFDCEIFDNLNPDTVVAKGAAIQAGNLVGNTNKNTLLLDVTPLSLGIEIMGGITEKIIHRNTPIPIRKSQFFTTFKDNQTGIVIHILQGERERVEDCRSLAKFSIKGIEPMKASKAKLEVSFQLDADGILIVSAYEHKSKKQAEIMVQPSYGLDEKQIEAMIKSSYENAKSDTDFRSQKNSLMKAKRLVEEVNSALTDDSGLLNENELNEIKTNIQNINKIIDSQNLTENQRKELINLTNELAKKANSFANKRLKKSLETIKNK